MQSIEDVIAELQGAFRRRLPARVRLLSEAVAAGVSAPGEASLRDAALALAHALHGTAGSYGLTRAGALAGAIEDALDDLRAGRTEAGAAWSAAASAAAELTRVAMEG